MGGTPLEWFTSEPIGSLALIAGSRLFRLRPPRIYTMVPDGTLPAEFATTSSRGASGGACNRNASEYPSTTIDPSGSRVMAEPAIGVVAKFNTDDPSGEYPSAQGGRAALPGFISTRGQSDQSIIKSTFLSQF